MAPIRYFRSKTSLFKLLLTAATFVALAVAIYALRQQIGSVITDLGKVNAWALLLIIPLQALNYHAYARFYIHILSTLGERVNYKSMYRLTLELNFINHILPSGGVSGISYFSMRSRPLGISTAQSTMTQLMKLLLLFVSFQPLLVLGVIVLAADGHVNNFVLALASSLVTLLIIGTVVAVYIAESRRRVNALLGFMANLLNKIIGLVRRGHPAAINMERASRAFDELHDNYVLLKKRWRQLKMPFLYMLLANITEVASVYVVYIAFGNFVNVGAVILAYAVANFAGLISILPAGIGVFEGLMTATLAATGIAASLSIPVTIMYRVVSMFVQLLPGYVFYQRSLQAGFTKPPK